MRTRASISIFQCWVLNKWTTGTIFIMSLVWRGPWLGIEPGTSRTRSQHSTIRLSRRWFFEAGYFVIDVFKPWPNPDLYARSNILFKIFMIRNKLTSTYHGCQSCKLTVFSTEVWNKGNKTTNSRGLCMHLNHQPLYIE